MPARHDAFQILRNHPHVVANKRIEGVAPIQTFVADIIPRSAVLVDQQNVIISNVEQEIFVKGKRLDLQLDDLIHQMSNDKTWRVSKVFFHISSTTIWVESSVTPSK